MWLVYLLAAVLGGGLLLVQVVSGGKGDAGDLHPDGPGFLSTRALVYGLFAFGFVGAALHVPSLLAPTGALVVAVLAGAFTTVGVGYTLHAIGHPQAAGTGDYREAVGRTARVLVPLQAGGRGKIRVALKGHQVDLLAVSDGYGDVLEGSEVVIHEVTDHVAHVRPLGAPERRS